MLCMEQPTRHQAMTSDSTRCDFGGCGNDSCVQERVGACNLAKTGLGKEIFNCRGLDTVHNRKINGQTVSHIPSFTCSYPYGEYKDVYYIRQDECKVVKRNNVRQLTSQCESEKAKALFKQAEQEELERSTYIKKLNNEHPCILPDQRNKTNLCVRQGVTYVIDDQYGFCTGAGNTRDCTQPVLNSNPGKVTAKFRSEGESAYIDASNGYAKTEIKIPSTRYLPVLSKLSISHQNFDACVAQRNCATQQYTLQYPDKNKSGSSVVYTIGCTNLRKGETGGFVCPTGIIPTNM